MREAVGLARQGSKEGQTYLYEQTYRKAYYVALKYMQNEDNALDVVQDAYIKAFSRLEQLDDDDKFDKWINSIVASTALDALKKKKPQLFTDMSNDDEEFDVSEKFEANYTEQPEVVVDQNETARLVQEIISELSDEQRACVTMYYMQEMSVKEISGILNVSDNTVKSRLNYARKNIEAKVKELEKKGTKLYALAPIPFFVFLLHTEADACEATAAAGLFTANAGAGAAGSASSAAGSATSGDYASGATSGVSAAGAAAGTLSLGAKVAIGIISAVVVIGGAIGVGVAVNNSFDDDNTTVESESNNESSNKQDKNKEALSNYYDSSLISQYGVADPDFAVNFDGEEGMWQVKDFSSKPGLMGKKFVDVDNDGVEEMLVPIVEYFATEDSQHSSGSIQVKLLIYKNDSKSGQVSEVTNGQIISPNFGYVGHMQCAYRIVDGLFYVYFTEAAPHSLTQGVFYGMAYVYSFDGKVVAKLVDVPSDQYGFNRTDGNRALNLASSYMPSIIGEVNKVVPSDGFSGLNLTIDSDFVLFKPLSKTDPEYKDIFSWTMYKDRNGTRDTMIGDEGKGTIHGYYNFYQ